jgi:hypothetical protein
VFSLPRKWYHLVGWNGEREVEYDEGRRSLDSWLIPLLAVVNSSTESIMNRLNCFAPPLQRELIQIY